ncbi:MAG: aminoacyl-tRNA hydrolase [Bacteroidota bacterium]
MKFLIAGLGNIGAEYRGTRHNIGFMVLDYLAEQKGVDFESSRYATTCTIRHRGRQLVLIKPTTYMNLSGKAVRFHLQEHKLSLQQLLVVTDDIALPYGKLRMRPRGSAGGHNGLQHIADIMGTKDYPRLRFGVGDDFSRGRQADYVLSPFSEDEQIDLSLKIEACAKGVLAFASVGINRAMNDVNRKG